MIQRRLAGAGPVTGLPLTRLARQLKRKTDSALAGHPAQRQS
jgi:hypothetical protein